MAKEDRPLTASPTLPLPPPREIAKISMDQFFEVASAAALRALDAHARQAAAGPDPIPWHPQIWVGIIASSTHLQETLTGKR